jgi:hypothetical protein
VQERSGANRHDSGIIFLVVSGDHLGFSELGVLGSVRKKHAGNTCRFEIVQYGVCNIRNMRLSYLTAEMDCRR